MKKKQAELIPTGVQNTSTTKIATCKCSHKQQDEWYGLFKRVFNKMKSGSWRCTVCGSVIK